MGFRVGQKVVCINNRPMNGYFWCRGERPTLGAVYTIRRAFVFEGLATVWLDEIKRAPPSQQDWGPDVGYAAFRFRPMAKRETDISIFTKILDNAPQRELVNTSGELSR